MDELKLELVRDLTKKVYGENYDQSQYEHMLKFYHDFNNFFRRSLLKRFRLFRETLLKWF